MLTETYSPAPMLIAPAASPATPAITIAPRSLVAPAAPITMPAVETMPSLAPSTAARSQLSRLLSPPACGSSSCGQQRARRRRGHRADRDRSRVAALWSWLDVPPTSGPGKEGKAAHQPWWGSIRRGIRSLTTTRATATTAERRTPCGSPVRGSSGERCSRSGRVADRVGHHALTIAPNTATPIALPTERANIVAPVVTARDSQPTADWAAMTAGATASRSRCPSRSRAAPAAGASSHRRR